MPEGQRYGFHSSFYYWLLVWSGISYQSLCSWFIHSLLHKQTGMNQPTGSQNTSFLGLAFYVPMTYFPSSAPRIVSWWQLFLIKIESSWLPLRICLHFPHYVQQAKKEFHWFPQTLTHTALFLREQKLSSSPTQWVIGHYVIEHLLELKTKYIHLV